ncbi:MAG: transporter substrate-binding domain-containing protein [Rhodomicrobium sp.]
MRTGWVGCGRRWLFAMVALFACALGAGFEAEAQTCGTDYTIKEGESLADIASRVYGSSSQWTLIFYANQDRMGANASMLVPGLSIRIPCIGGQQAPVAAAPSAPAASQPSAPTGDEIELSSVVKRIEFLTADGFTPFTDRSLPNGGMITQIVSSSMDIIKERSGGAFSYNVSWVNDWAAHLNPLLITRAFDVGFPWLKPDCSHAADLSQDAKYRCQKFFFSDPLYEVFTVLFVKSHSPITFAKDEEILGKTLCQPAGQSTYELDKGGRNWVKDNKVILLRPQNIEECFRLLDSGSVNAVVAPDLTGKSVTTALGLTDKVKALPRPVAIGTLHLIVPKTHPHASTVLYYINTALSKLRESGEYDKIVDSHLSRFWSANERR